MSPRRTRRKLPVVRPTTRAECREAARPCPWVGCKLHLLLNIAEDGALSIARPKSGPGRRPQLVEGPETRWLVDRWMDYAVEVLAEMDETCAQDVVNKYGRPLTFSEIGALLGLPKQNAEKEHASALRKLRDSDVDLEEPEDR